MNKSAQKGDKIYNDYEITDLSFRYHEGKIPAEDVIRYWKILKDKDLSGLQKSKYFEKVNGENVEKSIDIESIQRFITKYDDVVKYYEREGDFESLLKVMNIKEDAQQKMYLKNEMSQLLKTKNFHDKTDHAITALKYAEIINFENFADVFTGSNYPDVIVGGNGVSDLVKQIKLNDETITNIKDENIIDTYFPNIEKYEHIATLSRQYNMQIPITTAENLSKLTRDYSAGRERTFTDMTADAFRLYQEKMSEGSKIYEMSQGNRDLKSLLPVLAKTKNMELFSDESLDVMGFQKFWHIANYIEGSDKQLNFDK